MSESNRSNFIDTNRLHAVIHIVKIAWRVTSVKCFVCAPLRKIQLHSRNKNSKKIIYLILNSSHFLFLSIIIQTSYAYTLLHCYYSSWDVMLFPLNIVACIFRSSSPITIPFNFVLSSNVFDFSLNNMLPFLCKIFIFKQTLLSWAPDIYLNCFLLFLLISPQIPQTQHVLDINYH